MNDIKATATAERERSELSERLREQRPMFERMLETAEWFRKAKGFNQGDRFYQ